MKKQSQNKPNTNPIQTQSNPIKPNLLDAQMNVTSILTKDYENVPLRREFYHLAFRVLI
ncbi:hypothetical protein ES703_42496 [subsurface metagenome]